MVAAVLCVPPFCQAETASKHHTKSLTLDTINPHIRAMEYAVRGPVVQRADKLATEEGRSITYTNIGNPQAVGQTPLTWPRQVLALCDLPPAVGMDHPNVATLFPVDAVARAREILASTQSTGAYSHSQGIRALREDVAAFIQERDGVACDVDDLFLTNGASAAIQMVLSALSSHEKCGVMVPIPQYPIYTATIRVLNGQTVGYYLDEDKDWELNVEELERAYQEAVEAGIDVRAMVLINPGNPTGQVLSEANVQSVVRFCVEHNIVLLADEVYQENVYMSNRKFYSCKRAAYDLDMEPELVSFHSTSKGVFGECGRRGGYMELVGIDKDVKDQLYKLASSSLCSSVAGQIMTALMCRGPSPGDASYESHNREKQAIYDSLRRKSTQVVDGLNKIPGISSRPAAGAMYCFVKVDGIEDDTDYCVSLLEHTGICVVPASGFGQKEGRHGFRMTFLPDNVASCVKAIEDHHILYMARLKRIQNEAS